MIDYEYYYRIIKGVPVHPRHPLDLPVDPEIQQWRTKENPCFQGKIAGVLCRRWIPCNQPAEVCDQVVLPWSLWIYILKLAHDELMAGHMGHDRTLQQIRKRFWWPGVAEDVRKFEQSWLECQKVAKRNAKALLIPMPVVDRPFQRIAMDVVGQLPTTASANQYILVICDYATRYSGAYLLRTFTAPKVAEKLQVFFSLHWTPQKILTYQGTKNQHCYENCNSH